MPLSAEKPMNNFILDDSGRLLISDYQNIRSFASFLPGIAGRMGIPLWVFYVNRGQAIASFGVENKDKPIMEFQAANLAYRQTSSLGFRTFIKVDQGGTVYEPFRQAVSSQSMQIGANELTLTENNHALNLETNVVYFLLPNEDLGGLVRMLTVKNLSEQPHHIEILDGLPAITPFGVTNQILKEIGRTAEAWMEVYNVDRKIPFYRLRASITDSTEISSFDAGNFMLSFQDGSGGEILPIIVDPAVIFEQNTSLSVPDAFCRIAIPELLSRKQITGGRTPCGFAASQAEIPPGGFLRLNSVLGHVDRLESIQSHCKYITEPDYLDGKRSEANELVHSLTDFINTQTSSPLFDAYCRQNLLDNTLRGGWPIVLGQEEKAKVYHVFSRKHGDLERDYNAFSFAPEFYSQGNGNYRDVNQNRREDVWFNPDVADGNIRLFMSLIQLDGYNPLVIHGSSFSILPAALEGLLGSVENPEETREIFSHAFSPGSLIKGIKNGTIQLKIGIQDFLEKVLENSQQHVEVSTGEGYWVDHWTYNMDMIDSYLSIFPDRCHDLLFSDHVLPYYDSSLLVQPRSLKYVLKDGQPRQLESLVHDPRKAAMLASRRCDPFWVRVNHGRGSVYRTCLFVKLFSLALIKFSTLDPFGMGIEMEAGRPGWNDAMNGLPALFGSSVAETYVLNRLVEFLIYSLKHETITHVRLPVEILRLLRRIRKELRRSQKYISAERDLKYWDNVSSAREKFRTSIRMGLDGAEEELAVQDLLAILKEFREKLNEGIIRATRLNNGLPPTYFSFRVDEFEKIEDKQRKQKVDKRGRPYIRVRRFTPQPMPLFLEGMVRAMNGLDSGPALSLYKQVKDSPLYDGDLKMYKLNASLAGLPNDIGRARAFTPGWLENESVWLHMEYKYLLETLRAGLYDEFFQDLKTALIPFLDPQRYGRSPLENSSFLVSSVHPDESLHGAGFVARLSGATAEFLSMWRQMMAGPKPFFVKEDQLCLALKPALPGWMFDENNKVSFRFLGRTTVTYHNPDRMDTYNPDSTICSCALFMANGNTIQLQGGVIPAPFAQQVRDRLMERIEISFSCL
jgi:hypothetical protein